MAETVTAKLNLPKDSYFTEFPRDFLGKSIKQGVATVYDDLTNYARLMLAVIHTMNKAVKGYCKITYDDFIDRLGGSKETVSRCKKLLIDKDIIEDLGNSKYKIKTAYNKKYIKIGDYLHKTVWEMEFETDNVKRRVNKRLKRSTVINISYLIQQNENKKTAGSYISSQGRLGKTLNIPRTTICDSQKELIAAALCTCTLITTDEYGAGKKGLTKYEVVQQVRDVKLCKPQAVTNVSLDQKKSLSKKEKKFQEATLQVKIERHYYNLHHIAEEKAERERDRACSDEVYFKLQRELNNVGIDLAFAEVRDKAQAKQLRIRQKELETAIDKRCKEIGIDKRLLEPQYKCTACSDTGYLTTGQPCECLKQFIKELKI